MFLPEFLLLVLWMLTVPVLIGTLVINQLFKAKETDLLLAVACGFICMFAIFYILVMPMLLLKVSLQILVICWSFLMLCLSITSLVMNRKRLKEILSYNLLQMKMLPKIAIIVIVLVMAQAFVSSWYVHEDADDAFFVAAATTAVSTNSILEFDPYTGLSLDVYPARYVFSPFPIFIALLSKILMLHPAIVAHTVLPAVLIPLSYIILAVLGKKLFPDRPSSVMLFLLFICVLNVFGNTSVYTNSSFLLFRIWQGKAVLANIVLPAILYFSFCAMSEPNKRGEWIILVACVLSAILASSMGIILAPIMIVCLGFVFAMQNKKLSTFALSIACCIPCIACGVISLVMY